MTKYAEQVAQLQSKIVQYQYYVPLWERQLLDNGMTAMGVQEQLYSPEALSHALFEFWAALPDSMAIRRDPFFELCDLCEWEGDES